MKKYLTLSNATKVGAVVFGLVSFFLMFGDQLYAELLGNKGYMSYSDSMFGKNGSVITFIGYLLIGISVVAVCVLVFLGLDAKLKKLINLGLSLLLIVGAVFVFIESAVVNGNVGTSLYHLAACPIIAGIFALVAAVVLAASEFVPDKKLLK